MKNKNGTANKLLSFMMTTFIVILIVFSAMFTLLTFFGTLIGVIDEGLHFIGLGLLCLALVFAILAKKFFT